jgi:carbon-monoxide dehydrogenase large subunit
VDPDDGTVRLERHVIVVDVGRAINPLIVHDQMHGGAAQGRFSRAQRTSNPGCSSEQVVSNLPLQYEDPRRITPCYGTRAAPADQPFTTTVR